MMLWKHLLRNVKQFYANDGSYLRFEIAPKQRVKAFSCLREKAKRFKRLRVSIKAGKWPIPPWPWHRKVLPRRAFKSLSTQRCILRLGRTRDVAAFAREAGTPNIAKWMLNFPSPFPIEMVRRRFRENWQCFSKGHSVSLVAIDRVSGALVGGVALNNITTLPEPELAYWIVEGRWQQGYGQEIIRAMIDYAFFCKGYAKIRASVLQKNVASIGLLRKMGFVSNGIEYVMAPSYAPVVGTHLENDTFHSRHKGSFTILVPLEKWVLHKEAWKG